MERPDGKLLFAPQLERYDQSSDTEESTSEPEPVLPSISSSPLEDGRKSRDLELSRVASLVLRPFDKLPLPQMLLEPQAPLFVE
jgi:hypothetical protein